MAPRDQRQSDDPSVIVGLSCRLPGASTPSKLWQSIVEQRDVQQEMPEDRFKIESFFHPEPTHKGTTNARFGYFLDQDIGNFDAGFFGISGKEAEAMDPQQRLLLEVVFEALENAGITLQEIRGSSTSVFCGSFTNDYNALITKDLEQYPKYTVTGTGNSILSNRISYFYDLHGTSITVDTACSSSLVCFHLGSQTLQQGEAHIAIVVGSSLHYDSNIFVTMTDLGMLSTNGRCATFDASGSGYVRGEGITCAILKRKSDALANGDTIRAIVRATGTNHDGKKSGITLPNSVAQEQLIRSTYERAGLNPHHTQYFEAHGTGTAAGDPIETRAIGAVFAPSRDSPLFVGSVKTNIGHLEGASGLAGIIKTTLALEKGLIPPNMHFKNPNPKIDFENWKIVVPTRSVEWKVPEGVPRRASINSFGYGGTNAHVVLEAFREARSPLRPPPVELHSRPYLIPLTSHSPKAGEMSEAMIRNYVSEFADVTVADLAHSLSWRRTMHQQRSFAVASDKTGLIQQLSTPRPTAPWTVAKNTTPRLGFIFTGQGAQWFAMGRQLIEECPHFRQSLQRCDAVLKGLPDAPEWSIVTELSKTKETSLLGETLYSQTICTALQLGIMNLIACWGIKPSAVVGHSSGEMGAAYAAGILSFESALIAAYYRGRYMSANRDEGAPGGMMAVGLTENICIEELKPYAGRLTIAAVNSPSSMTVSGDEDAIIELKESLSAKNVFVRQLMVKQAFHSHHMFSLASAYENALKNNSEFKTGKPKCRMFSSVTSRLADDQTMGASYWAANMVRPVRFSDALTGILLDDEDEQNVDVLVEIGPHPALKGPARQIVQALKLDLPYVASLTRGVPDFEGLLNMAGTLFCLGYPVDIMAANQSLSQNLDGSVITTATGKKLDDLPTYTWEHRRYWSETRYIKEHRQRDFRHALLGHRVAGSVARHPTFRNFLRLSELPWLHEHVVENKIVFPGAGYISMAIEAAVRSDKIESVKMIHLKDVVVKKALLIPSNDEGVEVLLKLKPVTTSAKSHSDTWYEFSVFSYDENSNCTSHCHGLISVEKGRSTVLKYTARYPDGIAFPELRRKTFRSMSPGTFYTNLANLGLAYGDKFRLLNSNIESGVGFAISDLVFDPKELPSDAGDDTILHPTLLDSFFHVIFHAVENRLGRTLDEPYVPSFLRALRISGHFFDSRHSTNVKSFQVGSFTRLSSPRVAINDMIMQNEEGSLMMEIAGLEATSLGSEALNGQAPRTLFYRQRWQPAFDMMTNGQGKPLEELVDIFAHQHPNTRILHVTPDLDKTREIVRSLGVGPGERRRFKELHAWSSKCRDFGPDGEKAFTASQGLVKVAKPAGYYDLVVVSEPAIDAGPFIRDTGIIIFDGQDDAIHPGLQELFSSSVCTGFKKTSEPFFLLSELTVVMPFGQPSSRASHILREIEVSHRGGITFTNLKHLASAGTESLSRNVAVLAGLDESISDDLIFRGAQALLTSHNMNVVWLTEGAFLEASRPECAMFIGLIRAARSENDTLRAVIFDVGTDSLAHSVAKEILRLFDERITDDEIAERNGIKYIARVEADDERNCKLRNGPNQEARPEVFGSPGTQMPLALKIGKVGLLETLHFEEDTSIIDTELASNEIEIEIKASSINFRDIAASMGIIEDFNLGDDCAGICTQVGADVKGFKLGDRVVALRPGQGAHRSLVRNPAPWCFRIPDSLSYSNAAAMSLTTGTAWYALHYTARLGKGETILIHSAAGGVGQMAVQLAQRAGARIFATVGSPSKRQLLQDMYGLKREDIFSSRDESFERAVMEATNGRGVDVVLNSLAGSLLHASWACLAPFGRFLEIGKRDIYENGKISMDPFRRNVLFASIDLVTMFEKSESLGELILKECFALLSKGEIRAPATIREMPYSDIVKAFRLLQMGKHAGKIVLVPHPEDIVPVMRSGYRDVKLFSPQKTYLLVGGLGGLGRTLSQWMVRKGATKLAFLSRSGTEKPEAKATIEWLLERGVEASVHLGDVSKLDDVQKCINGIGSSLGGVFQAAMVLRDSSLGTMTYEQWKRCCQPKVNGTRNLHLATLDANLDFFVCFSSIAGVIGSKGQANYAAANCYLDALMRHRRELGLRGTTMNVGVVRGVGVVAENEVLQKVMSRMGMDTISEEELLYQLEEAVLSDRSAMQMTSRGCDGHQIISGVGLISPEVYWAGQPLMKNLYTNHDFGTDDVAKSSKKLSSILAEEPDAEKKTKILLDGFLEKIASVLATPRESILPSNPLSTYGLDSIVAVEFRKWFRKEVHVDIALFDILGAASIYALVVKTARLVGTTSASAKERLDVKIGKKEATESGKAKEQSHLSAMVTGQLTKTQHSGVTPLSTFQSRLWFFHSFLDDKSFLNLPIVLRIKGNPDHATLQKTMKEMAHRNPALRTAYFEGDEYTVQEPVEDYEFDIDIRDLSHEHDTEEALTEFVNYNRKIEMNIEEGEVAAYSLTKLGEEEWAIVSMIHHISIDRGSLFPMMSQFVAIYDALRSDGHASSVAKPEFDYVDFTMWHNARLGSDLMKPELDWWRLTLDGAPQSSKLLPFAKGERPARSEHRRQKVRTNLSAKLFRRMKRIAAQSNGTSFHFVLAAFRACLYRYTEEEDLVLLMVDGNRPHPETDSLVGFFVNLAPVRCNDDCSVPFDQLFQATKSRALDALAHSGVPFDAIVDTMKVKKTTSHMPVGQIAVNYQIHGPAPKFTTCDFVVEEIESEDIPTAADIQLEAIETSEHSLDLKIEYSIALYDAADMERFLDNFHAFLASCIKDHRQPVEEISMCGPLEIQHLQNKYWNMETRDNQWGERSVLDVISQMARQHPHIAAIRTSDYQTMTYGQLMESAESVASELLDAGAQPGDRIGLVALPGIEAVTGMLAALMTGCCYVALDSDFAHDRLCFMLTDSGAKLLLVGSDQDDFAADLLSKLVVTPRAIRIPDVARAAQTISCPRARLPNDPFYMIYTSGSTGTPKGVVLSECNTQAMLSTLNKDYSFTRADNFLAHTTLAFDLSIVQIFGGLTAGATICIASRETRKDPVALADFMMREGVTVTYFTPTQFALLLEFNSEALRRCYWYRIAYFAGERLPVRVAKAFYDLGTPATLYNAWSPSELVVQTSIGKIDYPEEGVVGLPIGLPMDNCRHYLLDARGNPVPAGQIGEIVVGGAQVGVGYLNRPEMNARSFLQDHFASEDDHKRGWTRMFKTGDRGRFRPDGQLEFHGRIAGDKQIKLRGFRVDLGEVEQVIFKESQTMNKGGALVDIAVVARRVGSEEQQVIAYLVPKADSTASQTDRAAIVSSLHQKIKSRLNYYMLPNGYQFLDQLPVTLGGKVDRRKLLEGQLELVFPSSGTASSGRSTSSGLSDKAVRSSSQVQDTVLALFRSTLRGEIGLDESFFDKGGNSILLVRLQSKIKKQFKIAPPLPALIREPTAAAVFAYLQRTKGGDAARKEGLENAISWGVETNLPNTSQYNTRYGIPRVGREEVRSILLTGPESFVGIHVLAEILKEKREATVHVLGSLERLTMQTLIEKLDKHQLAGKDLSMEEVGRRVSCLPGSLNEAGFGLSRSAFRELGRSVESIYHLGGHVSLLKTYSSLKPINVSPILDLIKLSGMGPRLSDIHYLSTWSVPHLQTWKASKRSREGYVVGEEDSSHFLPPTEDDQGYFKTRWVAENLLTKAAQRGFPVTITRASSISASSRGYGIPDPGDEFVMRIVAGMIESGTVPQIGQPDQPSFSVDMVPVDWLASNLVALTCHKRVEPSPSERHRSPQIYHVTNPRPLRLRDLPQMMGQLGSGRAQARMVSLEEWLDGMESDSGEDAAASKVVRNAVLRQYLSAGGVLFSLDNKRTMGVLETLRPGVVAQCPAVDVDFLSSLLTRIQRDDGADGADGDDF